MISIQLTHSSTYIHYSESVFSVFIVVFGQNEVFSYCIFDHIQLFSVSDGFKRAKMGKSIREKIRATLFSRI